jgi:hypothetical protein
MKDIKKRASDDIQVEKKFEMFATERLLSVTYYIRRRGETICRCAQAAADKGLREPKTVGTYRKYR